MADDHFRDDSYRPGLSDDEYLARREREFQPDPELAEGPASSGKIALFAVAIALVMGAVFYSLNNTSVNHASTEPPAKTAQTAPTNPAAPPGTRNNTRPGVTTGAATNPPASPSPPPPEANK